MKILMTPSELTALLARANDRLRSALTGASSLVLLALLALVGGYGVHKIQPGMAKTVAVLAVLGVVLLTLAYRFFRWQRDELYDDVVLHGFRHVHPQAVARRAAELVSRRQRRQIADTLDRFVEAAVETPPHPRARASRRADRAAAAGDRAVHDPAHSRTSSWSRPGWCCWAASSATAPPARCSG